MLSHSNSTPWSHHYILDCLAFYFQGNIIMTCFFAIETMNQATPARKLEEVLHLAELCIEVLQQNEEHHAEVTCFNCHVHTQNALP